MTRPMRLAAPVTSAVFVMGREESISLLGEDDGLGRAVAVGTVEEELVAVALEEEEAVLRVAELALLAAVRQVLELVGAAGDDAVVEVARERLRGLGGDGPVQVAAERAPGREAARGVLVDHAHVVGAADGHGELLGLLRLDALRAGLGAARLGHAPRSLEVAGGGAARA